MISEHEARAQILESVQARFSQAVEKVPLRAALGRIAASNVSATIHSPRFDNSSMDGYAVRAEEAAKAGARLKVSSQVQPAGLDREISVDSGEAVRIFTGGPIPKHCTAVIMQEDVTVSDGESLCVDIPIVPGENIRRKVGICASGSECCRLVIVWVQPLLGYWRLRAFLKWRSSASRESSL